MYADFCGLHIAEAWTGMEQPSRHMSGGVGLVLGPRCARVDVCETRRPPGTGDVAGDELLLIAPATQAHPSPPQVSAKDSANQVSPLQFGQRQMARRFSQPADRAPSLPPLRYAIQCNPAKPIEDIPRRPEAR
ncbi:hypothetical protein RRF57_007711 [Xylaria bambusicola]|uniref:Uncharacterized protein n=1 Tax=Xylaria bambusicola TaxID=326684 RepID=A0AAN7Z6I1_9PEZI